MIIWKCACFRGLLLAAVTGVAAALPPELAAQTVTLRDALTRADAAAFANRIAAGRAAEQAGNAAGALRGFLPAVRLEAGYVRTTDPLGAFGSLLQQRGVTPVAFDPARLNDPAVTGSASAAAIVEQPLVNVDAWYGRRAARQAAEAARAAEEWTRSGTQLEVVRAFYGAVLAADMVDGLDTALASARAHVRQAEALHRNGLVTRADVLLASVRAGEVETRRLAALGEADLAGARLALTIGVPAGSVDPAAVRLPAAAAIRAFVAADSGAPTAGTAAARADVRAASRALDAAAADARRATAALLPRINAFGRVDWHTAEAPFGGEPSWTAGVMASWSPFSGGAELAERRAAAGRRAGAEAGAAAAAAQARLEQAQTEIALRVALERMSIAERAVAQSVEAHRIVSRKYEGGLAGITELFDAAATETASRLGYAAARYEAIIAAADQRRATGRDVGAIATLEEME